MENKSNSKFLIPLVIAIFFAIGIYLGTQFNQKTFVENPIGDTNSKFATILQVIEDR